jgi:hypothetical protein
LPTKEIDKNLPQLSKQFKFLILCLSLTIFIVVFLLFIKIFYFPQSQTLGELWSYWLEDRPWTPNGIVPQVIFQNHYFGDFQLAIIYSSLDNPFNWNGEGLAYGYPPVFHQLFKLLSIFPVQIVFIGYVLISLLSVFVVLRSMLKNIQVEVPTLLSLLLMTWCLPLFISIDRGNFVVITVSLAAYVMHRAFERSLCSTKSQMLALLYLYIAISLKLYILMLILIIFFLGYKKLILKLIATLIISNLFVSALFYPDLKQVVATYIQSILLYSDNSDPLFVLNGTGLFASFAAFSNLFSSGFDVEIAREFGSYANLFGYLWFALSCMFIFFTKLSKSSKFAISMSNLQFFAPVSMSYTGIWLIFAAAALLGEFLESTLKSPGSKIEFQSSWLFLATFICMAPVPISAFKYIPALIWTLIFLYLLTSESVVKGREIFKYIRKSKN